MKNKKLIIGVIVCLCLILLGNAIYLTVIYNMHRENYSLPASIVVPLVYGETIPNGEIDVDTAKQNEEQITRLEDNVQTAFENAYFERVTEVAEQLEEEKRQAEEAERKRIEEEKKAAELAAYRAEVGDTYNPFVKTGLTAEQFNIMLEGTGLAGCGESYYNMEQTYGVNGVFAIGVAFHESGYGRYKANTNNFYGMRNGSGWMAFDTPDANIQYFGRLMNQSLYAGKSIDGIGQIYCPGTSASWASAVRSMMSSCYAKV